METKILDIDITAIENQLSTLGVKKVFDAVRTITYFKNEKDVMEPFLKLTEEGDKLKLTSQDHNNKEVKLFVSRKEECVALLSTLGYKPVSEVQAHRLSYELGTIDLDIDEFPGIPAFLEIDMGDNPSISSDNLIANLQLTSNKTGQMSTPEIVSSYGKNYFEIYKFE